MGFLVKFYLFPMRDLFACSSAFKHFKVSSLRLTFTLMLIFISVILSRGDFWESGLSSLSSFSSDYVHELLQ